MKPLAASPFRVNVKPLPYVYTFSTSLNSETIANEGGWLSFYTQALRPGHRLEIKGRIRGLILSKRAEVLMQSDADGEKGSAIIKSTSSWGPWKKEKSIHFFMKHYSISTPPHIVKQIHSSMCLSLGFLGTLEWKSKPRLGDFPPLNEAVLAFTQTNR